MAKKILFEDASEFSRYKVVDMMYNGRQSRMLFAGNDTPQSGLAVDDDPELLFDYNQRFLEIALSIQPRRVLVIGGGALTLPKALLERLGGITRIDVVEIDPLLPDIARQYFGVPDDPRLHVLVGDGRLYINKAEHTYDLIVVDAFSEFIIPRPLMTVQAARQYARLLGPGGVFTINFISRYFTSKLQLTHQLKATFERVFKHVEFDPADPYYDKRAEQNMLMIAHDGSWGHFDYLQSAAVQVLPTSEPAGLTDDRTPMP